MKQPKLMKSGAFELNRLDMAGWWNRTLQNLAPYLIALIPVVISQVPKDWAYATLAVWLLNRVWDLLRRYVTNNKK